MYESNFEPREEDQEEAMRLQVEQEDREARDERDRAPENTATTAALRREIERDYHPDGQTPKYLEQIDALEERGINRITRYPAQSPHIAVGDAITREIERELQAEKEAMIDAASAKRHGQDARAPEGGEGLRETDLDGRVTISSDSVGVRMRVSHEGKLLQAFERVGMRPPAHVAISGKDAQLLGEALHDGRDLQVFGRDANGKAVDQVSVSNTRDVGRALYAQHSTALTSDGARFDAEKRGKDRELAEALIEHGKHAEAAREKATMREGTSNLERSESGPAVASNAAWTKEYAVTQDQKTGEVSYSREGEVKLRDDGRNIHLANDPKSIRDAVGLVKERGDERVEVRATDAEKRQAIMRECIRQNVKIAMPTKEVEAEYTKAHVAVAREQAIEKRNAAQRQQKQPVRGSEGPEIGE